MLVGAGPVSGKKGKKLRQSSKATAGKFSKEGITMTKKATYIFTTYLNASHAIRWAEGTGQIHPHTYEIKYEFHLKNIWQPQTVEKGWRLFCKNSTASS